jgi:glycosyltransferase involved in cell wall biosynthesis
MSEIESCGVAVVPSLYYEAGLPLTAIEALGHGRPIMVNRDTSFATVIGDDFSWRIEPAVSSWRQAMDTITQDDIETRGLAARKFYVETCSPSAAAMSLVKIYENLLRRDG